MRPCTAGQRALIAAQHVNHHIKVEVQDADRTYQDLTNLGGVNWVESGQWGDSLDTPTGTATISLRRDTTSPVVQSIAPTMGGSTLNRNGAGAYAPLLDTGRNLRISTAVTAPGVAPVTGDWHVDFIGRVDSVDWHSTPVVLECRDLGGWIVDAYIQQLRAYATSGPKAVEDIMAEVLGDTPVFGPPTLYTPASPGWEVNNSGNPPTTQAQKSVLEALQTDWALSIGWLCRYRWDASNNFQLTFFDPNRSKTTPDETFDPTEYRDITGLKIEDADVRNAFTGTYFDSDGNPRTRAAANGASQLKYGVKWMGVQFAKGDPIDTDGEMDTFLNAASNDLGLPFVTHEMQTLYYWPVQLCDLHQYNANLDHYDTAQKLGVVGYTHAFANGEIITTVQATGNVIGAYHAWLRRFASNALDSDATRTSVLRVTDTESTDGTLAKFALTVGDQVDHVQVYYRTVARDADNTAGQLYDFSDSAALPVDPPAPLVLPPDPTTRGVSFTFPQPGRDKKVTGRIIPYAATGNGVLVSGESITFTVNPSPPAINATIRATKVGALVTLSVDVAFGASDAPVTFALTETIHGVATTILTTTMTAPGTLDPGTFPVLANRAIPAGAEAVTYTGVLTDAAAVAWDVGPVSALPALVPAQITISEAAGVTTISASLTDAGGYLNAVGTDSLDPSIVGAVSYHVTALGVTTAVVPTTKPGSGTSGVYTLAVTQDPKHPTVVTGYRHYHDGSTDSLGSWTVDANKIAEGVVTAANAGAISTVTGRWDTDAAVGVNCVEYSLDFGVTWTATVTVGADYISQFTITRAATKQTVQVRAKNKSDGNWGAQYSVDIDAYLSESPSYDVHVVEGATSTQVFWSCTLGTVLLSINGGAPATPPASPITVARPVAGATKLNYKFSFTNAGNTVTDAVDVLPIDADTITPNLSVALGTPTATTMPYTATASNPRAGGAAPTMTVTCVGCTMTIAGTTYADGTTLTIASGTVVTGNKAGSTSTTQAVLAFIASLAGGGNEMIVVGVPPQLALGPSIIANYIALTAGTGQIVWSCTNGAPTVAIDGGAPATPAASPIPITLDATTHSYSFLATIDGQTMPAPVTVPAAGSGSFTFALAAPTAGPSGGPYTTLDIAWTATGFPAGTTFDVAYNNGGADCGSVTGVTGSSHTFTGVTFNGSPGGGSVTVSAQYAGKTLATKTTNGVYAF